MTYTIYFGENPNKLNVYDFITQTADISTISAKDTGNRYIISSLINAAMERGWFPVNNGVAVITTKRALDDYDAEESIIDWYGNFSS